MTSDSPPPSYPECLDMAWPIGRHILAEYDSQLREDANRLFLRENEQFAIKVLEFAESSNHSYVIKNAAELSEYLQNTTERATRILMVQQQSSWGSLAVSYDGMQQILAKLGAFPESIDMMRAFGQKISAKDESYSTLRFRASSNDMSTMDSAYVVKFAEEHHREDVTEKWSLRKSGVYHRSCAQLGNAVLILNPSRHLQLKLKDIVASGSRPSSQSIHLAILSSALDKWRWCISDIEERCSQVKTRAHLTSIEAVSSSKAAGGMDCDDFQDIQVLQDKLHVFQHALNGNSHILRSLPHGFTKPNATEFADLLSLAGGEIIRITSVLSRLSATSELVARILDLRCLGSLENNSRMLTDLIRFANNESALIVELGKKASHDADIVKMLTFVALVYLPASFTAGVMDMGYINVKQIGSSISLEFQSEFFVFLVLTAIFLCITLGAYLIWLHARKASWRKNSGSWTWRFFSP